LKSAYSLRRPVANVYLVRDRDRRLRRDLLAVLAVALPLSAAVLAYVWITSQVWDVGYEVLRLEQTLDSRLDQERHLRAEAASLSRNEGIEERAQSELGLHEVDLESVVFVEELE
jgi:cell division protein FtsL